MATSPAHKFGQLVGELLEEMIHPGLKEFCEGRGLYLDTPGARQARSGKKVTWTDNFGNKHDLDFVIEKDGTEARRGRPVAFIEAAWRRYTKHSKNKAQEIQGAVLPLAEKHGWDKPFLGVALAGEFTEAAVEQLKSLGFNVLHIPYSTVVDAFAGVGIDVRFDERTPDEDFQACVEKVEGLDDDQRGRLKAVLGDRAEKVLATFFEALAEALDRLVDRVTVMPLSGEGHVFECLEDAASFVEAFDEKRPSGRFRKFEAVVRYSNGDRVDGSFGDKAGLLRFLAYVAD